MKQMKGIEFIHPPISHCLARSHGLGDPVKSFYICKLNLQMFYTPSGALKDKKKCVVINDFRRLCGLVFYFNVALADPQHVLTVKATVFKDKQKYVNSGLHAIYAEEPISCDMLAAVATQRSRRLPPRWYVMSHIWLVLLILSVSGMRLSRYGAPLCFSWVFIRAPPTTTEYMTWLGTGTLGKSWKFGRLDGTQAVRSWPVPCRGGGILLQWLCVCVCDRPSGHPLGADPEQRQVYRAAAGRQAHMWLKSNRDKDL